MADDVFATRLATWQYTEAAVAGGQAQGTKLGFIIEDLPRETFATRDGGHVDMYAYVSGVVAALQRQQERIAALNAKVTELSATVAKLAGNRTA